MGIPATWIATDDAILTLPTHIRARATATMLPLGAKKRCSELRKPRIEVPPLTLTREQHLAKTSATITFEEEPQPVRGATAKKHHTHHQTQMDLV